MPENDPKSLEELRSRRRDRRWRLAFWLSLVGMLLLMGAWYYSLWYTIWHATPIAQCNDEVEESFRQWEVQRPHYATCKRNRYRLHGLADGDLILRYDWIHYDRESPTWVWIRHLEPPQVWGRMRSREIPGAIRIPIWKFIVAFSTLTVVFWRFAPARRAARRARRDGARIERRRPSPFQRSVLAAAFGMALLGLMPFTMEYCYNIMIAMFELDPLGDVPDWLWLVGFTTLWAVGPVLGALYVNRRLRWRRIRTDQPHCIHCRYNLTGNESGKCPECGNAIYPRQAEWLAQHSVAKRPEAVT